jgi:hypothetical protein
VLYALLSPLILDFLQNILPLENKKEDRSGMHLAVLHMSIVALMAILGNTILVLVICKGNAVARQKISPVQVGKCVFGVCAIRVAYTEKFQLLLLHTAVADLLFAFLTMGTEIPLLVTTRFKYSTNFVS